MIGDSGNAYVVALVILAMVLVAVVGYHWLPKADVQLAVGNCRLDQQTACAADLPGGGRIEVAVAPRPVATSQAFEFRADLAGNICRCGTYGRIFEAVHKCGNAPGKPETKTGALR